MAAFGIVNRFPGGTKDQYEAGISGASTTPATTAATSRASPSPRAG